MYFKSRVDAGQQLAKLIEKKYKGADCAVVALNDGGVMVGAQIALQLHCVLTMLMTEAINLPREDAAVGGISQDGAFSYNHKFSQGELDELTSEYYHFIEQEKMAKMQEMHRSQGTHGGLIRKSLIREKNIILVTDGLLDGFALDVALEYLKPIHINKIIVATPLASVPAVDRMHILADEIFCLSVLTDYISTDHYYDTSDIPPHDKVVKTIEQIISHWES
ncbi:MAG TPA: phosphoribosyltransferase family protein [Candidatus Saccharimonadales bacterium]